MRKIITALRNDYLLAAALGLGVVTGGVYAYQHILTPAKKVVLVEPKLVPVREALTTQPKAPVVRNTACGPEKTYLTVTFECVGDRPLGVQISNVFLRFADDRGEGDAVCANGKYNCRPVNALDQDEKDGFDWWRKEALSRYQPR